MDSDRPTATTFIFDHPELGSMTGLVAPDNVVQFRAVPYATIPARFKQSVLLDNLLSTDRKFTEHGFACPQLFGSVVTAGGPFPDYIHPPPSAEFKCLILQINVPLASLQNRLSKLPVLIYIHGGGFTLGKIDQQHNTALMVEQSILDSQPIISASIQYRVGALGFLHTSEPGGGNLALNDQKNALVWMQKFIAGFGGNPKNTTVFGESAGGMSICYQMLSAPPQSGPLFQRAILMSGVIGPMLAPLPVEEAKQQYVMFLGALGIQERADVSLEALRQIDVQETVDASAKMSGEGEMWLPAQDEEFFGEGSKLLTWDQIPELLGKCEWVDEIVLGTTRSEGVLLTPVLASLTPKTFLDGITAQLGPTSAESIAKAYHITPTMDQSLFLTAATRWVGDVLFDAPTHMLSRYLTAHTTKTVYRYIFDIRNPFPGHALSQYAHHWVDVYFVFKTYQFRYPTQTLKDISMRHAQLWADFANGKPPWSEYRYAGNEEEVVMVADERDGWAERSMREDEEITEVGWKRCEELWEAWKGKRGKWFSPLKIEPLRNKKLV